MPFLYFYIIVLYYNFSILYIVYSIILCNDDDYFVFVFVDICIEICYYSNGIYDNNLNILVCDNIVGFGIFYIFVDNKVLNDCVKIGNNFTAFLYNI
jgi:hypothetical protein